MSQATSRALGNDTASYARVQAPCVYFGTCGGCALQDLAYADQLRVKRARVERALASLGYTAPIELVGLDEPWRYRNKAELTFGQADGNVLLGYHAARSFWRVVDLEDCLLLPEPMMRVARDVRHLAEQSGERVYEPRTHHGFFRYVLLRRSHVTGAIFVCLITTSGSREVVETIAKELTARHPSVTGISWGMTNKLADAAIPETVTLLSGGDLLEEQIGPFRLRLRALSFLQPSTIQADRIYARLRDVVGDLSSGVAWDLYCGVGAISCYLSAAVQRVYSIDIEPQHQQLAAENAARNGLQNIEVRVGRVEEVLKDRRFWLQEAKPDVIVVDPPRAGLHPSALASVLAARPKRIAYLSCNVSTLVRDLAALCRSFPRYRLATVESFDMFPQTNHVEVLTVLERT